MAGFDQSLPMIVGFDYGLRVILRAQDGSPVFPDQCKLRADVRDYPGAPSALATLTMSNGGIVRIDDDTVDVWIDGSVTLKAVDDFLFVDLVRTDKTPAAYVYAQFRIPVIRSVTKV